MHFQNEEMDTGKIPGAKNIFSFSTNCPLSSRLLHNLSSSWYSEMKSFEYGIDMS